MGVTLMDRVTPMSMTKTQIYFPPSELKALHRVAKQTGRAVADLVREAVRTRWLSRPGGGDAGPVALWTGPFTGSSVDHDAAFDEP